MRVKLTDAALRSYKPRDAGYSVGDLFCPGLCVRITPTGVKSFRFAYRDRRAAGKVRWLTLGRFPDLPLTRARELANDARKAMTMDPPSVTQIQIGRSRVVGAGRTWLYRHYDCNGVLLYVGCSLRPVARLADHRLSPWFSQIAVVKLEQFDTRDAAFEAERVAITTERPVHNVYRPTPKLARGAA